MYLTKDYLHLYQLRDCIVPMTGCWSSIRACMLHYAAWLLCHTTSHVTRGTLHGTHYTLHGTRYMSRDARYTIHTIRRAMHRRQCHVTGHVVNPNTKPCNFSPDSSHSHRGKRIVPSMVKCYWWYRHIAAVCRLPGPWLLPVDIYWYLVHARRGSRHVAGPSYQSVVCSNAVQVQCCPLPQPPPPTQISPIIIHYTTPLHYPPLSLIISIVSIKGKKWISIAAALLSGAARCGQ